MSEIDPTDMTADEVQDEIADVEDADTLDEIFAAEKDGDNRKTVKAAIASRKSELQDEGDDPDAAEGEADEEAEDDESEDYSPPSARGNKVRLEFEEDPSDEDILDEGPEDAVAFEQAEADTGPDGTVYVTGEFVVPTEVTMNDPEAVEDEVGYSLSRRLAFAQELVDRASSSDVSRIDYTDAPGAPDYEAESGVLTFTEAGLRTGQDRDHKTQWMHKVASIVGDEAGVELDVQLEVLGEIEYDGISATLGHFFGEDEDDESEDSDEQEDDEAEE